MIYILIIISLFLDGIISTIITQNSYFIPHIVLTTLFIIYPKYKSNNSKYNFILIITGIIYDLLYTNLLFFHAIIFLTMGKLIKFFHQNYNQKTIMNILSLAIIIIFYIFLVSILLLVFKTTNIVFSNILDYIVKSILLNIIYLFLLNPLIKYKA